MGVIGGDADPWGRHAPPPGRSGGPSLPGGPKDVPGAGPGPRPRPLQNQTLEEAASDRHKATVQR